MNYLVSGNEMKEYDSNTTEILGMSPLVLMERAALATVAEIVRRKPGPNRVLAVAGCGNNGGDALAVGRLLALAGHEVVFVLIGDKNRCSPETTRQIVILEKYGFPIQSKIEKGEYDIIVDGIFGIGLSREVSGEYAEAIRNINRAGAEGALVVSVDIPSGIHAGTGAVLGKAVRAGLTVSYGFAKRGHYLYPGCDYTGELAVRDIGITEHSFRGNRPELFTYSGLADLKMPSRKKSGNKGTFGKVLLIAGQKSMAGACQLAGRGCLRSGAGMLAVLTHESNRVILQEALPEAMVSTYGTENAGRSENDMENIQKAARKWLTWAGCIVIGPGLGRNEQSELLLRTVLTESRLPLVLDADAIWLLGQSPELKNLFSRQSDRKRILTPHMGEFCGLTGCRMEEAKAPDFQFIRKTAQELNGTLVCKDARTYVCQAGRTEAYLNTSGNSGLATAGSGDVLAGIIGGLLAQGMADFEAACMGVHLHGLAGDFAAKQKSEYGVIASDIVEAVPAVIKAAGVYTKGGVLISGKDYYREFQ